MTAYTSDFYRLFPVQFVTSRDVEMKSSTKCDVEISITLDGEETVEPVPECLQGAFISSVHQPLPVLNNHVTLPLRYTQFVNNCTDVEEQKIGKEIENEEPGQRERDLSTALRWIKQEMVRDTIY